MSPLRSKLFSISAIFASTLTIFAITDEETKKTEGTANPEPVPSVSSDEEILSTITYPKEMVAKLFAREPNVQDPTAISFDEQNRLYIAETHRFDRGVEDNRRNPWTADDYALTSTAERLEMYKKYADNKPLSYFTEFSEKIRVIEDRDGDGKADFGQIYADGFNDPLDGTAAGVMALDGKIYFACIPHVWMLEDTDGDLVADKRESLQEGYGISVSLSGHDLNGFTLGPDNRIYFTIGDRGYNLKTKEGRHLYSQYEGAVFRMERDGSELEVVHTGLRNPKELAFDRYGNLFSVDNEADMQDMARVVDVVEGAHSGWQRGHQAFQKFTNLIYGTRRHDTNWMRERHWDMDSPLRPRAILAPAGWVSKGPSGLAYNPGTGLSEKWDNHFFVCNFVGANSSVIGFEMEPNGAGFKVASKENFVAGMLCTDIEFGYDSKAYVSDYVGSWPTHGFGNIFSFEDPKETAKPETKQVREIFANGFDGIPSEELAKLLRHPDMRVRLRAQLKLAEKPANRELLLAATQTSEPLTTRLNGVWGLGNLARLKDDEDSAKQLAKLTEDSDPQVRGQAVKALGDSGYKEGLDAALLLLVDSDLRTRMLAAIATGKLGTKAQIPLLMAVVKENNDQDEYLRHGVIEGLIRIGDADVVYAFANSESPAVRRAVVLALRRFQDARIGTFLNDSDISIAVETIQAINDNYIEGARKDLAAATHLLGKSTWAVDLRILNAMIRAGGEENVQRLIKVAENTSLSENARTEALWLIGRFDKHPPTDPTTGKYRPIKEEREISKSMRGKIQATLLPLLDSTTGTTLEETIGLAGKFNVKISQETLIGHLTAQKNPLGVRLAALKKLESDKPDDFVGILVSLTSDREASIRAATLQSLGRVSPDQAFEVTQKILASGKSSDKQLAIHLLATLKHPEAPNVLLDMMKNLESHPLAIHLDIIEATRKRGGDDLKKAVADYEASIPKDDPLAAFKITLEGGDPSSGNRIFFRNGMANCRQCHKVGNRGGDAGPNLQGLGTRQVAEYILESIIDPSAKLTLGYSATAITRKDGTIVAGMLAEESDTKVVIRDIETKEETTIKREDIANMPAPMSSMPPMGQILSKSQIRDLVAYLSSLKAE
ncbi:MAG: HEAT repeat domain-containing protein [Akkermansiaceae bacterium]